jgi:hypothetical protein
LLKPQVVIAGVPIPPLVTISFQDRWEWHSLVVMCALHKRLRPLLRAFTFSSQINQHDVTFSAPLTIRKPVP